MTRKGALPWKRNCLGRAQPWALGQMECLWQWAWDTHLQLNTVAIAQAQGSALDGSLEHCHAHWQPEPGWGEHRQLADECVCVCVLALRNGQNTRTAQIQVSALFMLLLFEQRKNYQLLHGSYFQKVWRETPKSISRELKLKDEIWMYKSLNIHSIEF